MICALTRSVDETRQLAGAVAGTVRAGDVLLLAGDLGAGKTAFVQGFAAALGSPDAVTSPTFTLVHTYRGGRLTVHHADVYRLDRLAEVLDLALGELLDDREPSVVVVEWGDVVAGALGNDHLLVRLELGALDDDRSLTLTATGPAWAGRWAALRQTLAPWEQPC